MWISKIDLFDKAVLNGVLMSQVDGWYIAKEVTTGLEVKRLKTKLGLINWSVNNRIDIKNLGGDK